MAAERTVAVVPRINDNGARSKSGQQRTIPVSDQVIRLYGTTCSPSTATWTATTSSLLVSRPRGQAWTYAGVYDLVLRLRRGPASLDPHWCRHAYATRALRMGADRGGLQAAWPLLDHHHAVRLRELSGIASDGREVQVA